jgi:hypothetical protein
VRPPGGDPVADAFGKENGNYRESQ